MVVQQPLLSGKHRLSHTGKKRPVGFYAIKAGPFQVRLFILLKSGF